MSLSLRGGEPESSIEASYEPSWPSSSSIWTESRDLEVTEVTKSSLLAGVLIGLLVVYRRLLSPLLGQNCRFYPTCSRYALDAIRAYGALRGGWMAVRRVSRCHPYHQGGLDPVP